MKLFIFWASIAVIVAGWNTAKYNGYDPVVMTKSIYSAQLEDKRKPEVVEKVYPKTFEHLHKITE